MKVVAATSVDELGIHFQWFTDKGNTRHTGFLGWDDVCEAQVYKRDLWAYDLICLAFFTRAGEEIELNEEDPNLTFLMEIMSTALPESKKWGDWFSKVAFPAFQTNPQTIYHR